MLGAVVFVLAGCGGGATDGGKTEPTKVKPTAEKPKVPLVPKVEVADWCPEHGVPESVCTRCNENLMAGFKAKGDWCETHNLPKSQCVACDPALKTRLDALKPKPK